VILLAALFLCSMLLHLWYIHVRIDRLSSKLESTLRPGALNLLSETAKLQGSLGDPKSRRL
jgi:hypothetical protein